MKAIIPAAGMGTRFLPVTKAIPKEMLPVVDKPIIQYAAEEAAAVGVTDILIITGRGKRAIEDHFDRSAELENVLYNGRKDEILRIVRNVSDISDFYYIRQKEPRGLGDAVRCGSSFTHQEPFWVLLGDIVVPERNILPKMLEVFEATGKSVIAVAPVAPEMVDRYGVIAGEECTDPSIPAGTWCVNALVEKPPVGQAPSNLAIVGRYLLTPKVMELLQGTRPGAGNEIQLTDALVDLLEHEEIYAVVVGAEDSFDTGNVLAWLEANIKIALKDERFGDAVRDMLKPLV